MSKKRLWRRLWRSRAGQGVTEYAILIALVSLGLILILGRYRNALANSYRNFICVANGNSVIIQAPVTPGGGGGGGGGNCGQGGGDDDDDD